MSLIDYAGQGRRLISRFFFEFLSGLPAGHCSDCYVYFRFKRQFPVYLTPRCMGKSTTPVLDTTVQVEEEITDDLLKFLQTGCVEMEVFAKKRPTIRQEPWQLGSSHKVGEANFAYLHDGSDEEDILGAKAAQKLKEQQEAAAAAAAAIPADYRLQNEQLQKQLQAMKAELQSKKKELKRTTKLTDTLRASRDAQEKRDAQTAAELQSQLSQLKDENKAIFRKLKDKESELKALLTKKPSRACSIM